VKRPGRSQHRDVADGPDRQRAEIGPRDRLRWSLCCGAQDLDQRHAERQELRHADQNIEGRTVDAVEMHVAADDVGRPPLCEHCSRDREVERAHAVADIEDDAALARQPHVRPNRAGGEDRRVGKRPKAVG
jgi:hypothetical protein